MNSKKNYQCLMVNANDKKLFTHKKNYPQLIEFSKTFGAEISIVRVKEAELLSFEELAAKMCDSRPQENVPDFKTLQTKIHKAGRPKKLKGRAKAMDTANRIRSYIELDFLSGNEVSLAKIKKKFKNHDLSDSAFCNHISHVKDHLAKQGYTITKVKAGTYRCSQ